MQFFRAAACLGFLLAFAALAPPCSASVVAAGQSPITRVVKLLEDISKTVEKEGKEEEDLYETFVCWAKSIVSQKTETNEAAQTRADMLQTYIDDLDAGKIELTTERVDLTKQIEELSGDMEVATTTREQEKKDYEEAKEEMTQAIDALEEAIKVLKTATEKHTEGVLLDIKAEASLESSAASRAKEAAALSSAVEIAKRVLTPGDAYFLQRLLTGEVPQWDWKKLNRKADFKGKYKARSFKIQDVLAKMLDMFKTNLADAGTKEQAAVKLYTELTDAKGKEKGTAEAALKAMEKEKGARGASKEESIEERDALLEQVKNDKKYIEQVEKSMAEKKQEWKERMPLRAAELAAISKAISILRDDDARDLFKKSFDSQGFLFLQEGMSAATSARLANSAAETLRTAAKQAHDSRLSVLALRLRTASGSHFTKVLKAINDMIKDLKAEEKDDLAKKDQCEVNRGKDAREAIKIARAMDELSEAMDADSAKAKEIAGEIEEKQSEIKTIQVELKEAEELRKKENKEYLVAKKDDEDALVVVKAAKKVLEDFYAQNKMSFIQQQKRGQAPFESEAGKAPPPPPSTWAEPYREKTDEATGVVDMLQTIYEDIQKDIEKAKTEEEESVARYAKTEKSMNDEINELNGAIDGLKEAKGEKIKAVEDTTGDRRTKRGDLDVVLKRITEAEPGCDFFAINYPVRLKNRQVEMDGLKKAKAILAGGRFSLIEEDATRKLLQGRLRASRKQTRMALE